MGPKTIYAQAELPPLIAWVLLSIIKTGLVSKY